MGHDSGHHTVYLEYGGDSEEEWHAFGEAKLFERGQRWMQAALMKAVQGMRRVESPCQYHCAFE